MFFITFCLLFLSLLAASEGQQKIKVKPEQDVTLQCWGPRDASVVMLEWVRPDLKSDGLVFSYRDGRPRENYQLPSFRGRVVLRDPEMKHGDFSVVLKEANTGDTGIYVCRAIIISRSETTYSEVMHLIDLKVQDLADYINLQTDEDENSDPAGKSHAGGFMSDVVNVIFLVLLLSGIPALGCLICAAHNRNKRNPRSQPSISQPPINQPSISQPPISQPPINQPPINQPLISQPPINQPPISQPSRNKPSISQPPISQPPISQPSISQPPINQPSINQPPISQPPINQPPINQPLISQPPINQPPISQPSRNKPSISQPPISQPSRNKPSRNQLSIKQLLRHQPFEHDDFGGFGD